MHEAVLVREVVDLLGVKRGGKFIDATAGGGGHLKAIMEKSNLQAALLALDKDEEAVNRVQEKMKTYGDSVKVVQSDFSEISKVAPAFGFKEVDGIIFDLGLSSYQLGDPDRGFSFSLDGPLDMRMDRSTGRTAADIVNNATESELTRIFKEYGQERYGKKVARAVVRHRVQKPFLTTGHLASFIERTLPGRRGRIHPATRIFQALRMAVNNEQSSLEAGLRDGLDLLKQGGRMAVISFHSLEDGMVKRFFRTHKGRMESLQQGGEKWCGEHPRVSAITRKPIVVSDEERVENPRSRSAKLRVAERVE